MRHPADFESGADSITGVEIQGVGSIASMLGGEGVSVAREPIVLFRKSIDI